MINDCRNCKRNSSHGGTCFVAGVENCIHHLLDERGMLVNRDVVIQYERDAETFLIAPGEKLIDENGFESTILKIKGINMKTGIIIAQVLVYSNELTKANRKQLFSLVKK